MKDQELDELLDQWTAPVMREAMRDELGAGFAGRPALARRAGLLRRVMGAVPRVRVRRLALVGLGAAVVLFALAQIAPRTVRMAPAGYRIPFYVEFNFARAAPNGLFPHPSRITSFPYAGHEIVMSVREPGHALQVAFRNIASSIRNQMVLLMPSIVLPEEPPMAEPAWFAGFVRSGCSEAKTVVGHENVAGHATTATQSDTPGGRIRIWMAPDLDCFALRMTVETAMPGGTYRLTLRKEAVKVTMNP